MFGYDFFGADSGSIFKWYGVFVPRSRNHTFFAVFFRSERAVHHKSDAVYKPHFSGCFTFKRYPYRLAGNKFRFGSRNRLARARLRQFVRGDTLLVFTRDVRQNE